MAWFRRRREPIQPTVDRDAFPADREHLERFAAAHRGVEAYVEPRTNMTQTTVMLIAHDGAWTRRRMSGPEAAHKWAHELAIPVYEVARVGYPQRMRDYNARQKRAQT